MNRPIAEHFTDIARAVLPRQADIVRADQDGDLRLLIDWPLGTDPGRPNKRSKSIELRISYEAMSDYANSDVRQKRVADKKLEERLKASLAEFDPDHGAPAHVVPPRDQWIIRTGDINP